MHSHHESALRRPRRTISATLVLSAVIVLAAACSASTDEAVPSSARVLVGLVLRTDTDGLADAAQKVAATGGTSAGEFLTLGEIRDRYGAPSDHIEDVIDGLSSHGIDGTADPTGAVVWAHVESDTAEKAFDVTLEVVDDETATELILPKSPPKIPEGIDHVTAVIGLTATAGETAGSTTSAVPTTSEDCSEDVMTRDALSSVYGLGPFMADDLSGAGTSVAILADDAADPSTLPTFDSCAGTDLSNGNVRFLSAPGGAKRRTSSETSLDSVVLSLLASEAQVSVVEFDGGSSLVFPLLTLLEDSHSTGSTPNALLSTLGYCESDQSPEEIAVAEWLLSAFAATGTTSVAAAGDHGSTACVPGSDDPAVQYPGSSAWASSVGGASFSGTVDSPSSLQVWNDAPQIEAAGGGGRSAVVERPDWQPSSPSGSTRMVPDFAAYAEPRGVGQVPVCSSAEGCTWESLGGTSLGASALASAVLLGAELGGEGTPVRFGHLAVGLTPDPDEARSVFTDITRGTNELDTKACCQATTGFDLASGWGLLHLDRLVAALS